MTRRGARSRRSGMQSTFALIAVRTTITSGPLGWGAHVEPGYHGKLVIHLQQRMPVRGCPAGRLAQVLAVAANRANRCLWPGGRHKSSWNRTRTH